MEKASRTEYVYKRDYIYHCLSLFFIYGFVGFVLEFFYRNIINGGSEMVGFLSFTPVLPIYGFMGVITYLFIRPIESTVERFDNGRNSVLIQIAVYAAFFTIVPAVLELIGGFTLKHIFKSEQWDYSNKPLNYKGYISLINLLVFSVLGTINMFIIFYKLDKLLVKYNKNRLIRIILYALVILLIADIIYTILKYFDVL